MGRRSGCLKKSKTLFSSLTETFYKKKPAVGLLSRVYVQQHALIKGKKKKIILYTKGFCFYCIYFTEISLYSCLFIVKALSTRILT